MMRPSLLQGPDGFPRQVDIEKKDNLYKIKYTPDDCGRYTIEALYDGKPLPQSPIHVQSFSTGNVSLLLHDRYCEILTLEQLTLICGNRGGAYHPKYPISRPKTDNLLVARDQSPYRLH